MIAIILKESFGNMTSLKNLFHKSFRIQTENIIQMDIANTIYDGPDLIMKPLTQEDIDQLPTDHFSKVGHHRHGRYLKKYPTLFRGYKFYDANNNFFIGYCWIMQKGANDSYFRIRKSDAYINEFYVNDQLRGRGYGPLMLLKLGDTLRQEHMKTITTSVHPANPRAIRCYSKAGFHQVDTLKFLRFLVFSIPYYSV